MIAWIDSLAKDWAGYLKYTPSGWPTQSVLHKIRVMGPVGAAIRSHHSVIPVSSIPVEIERFHRAWSTMEGKGFVYAYYSIKASPKSRAIQLGMSTSTMYERLGKAHDQLLLDMKIPKPE